MIQQLANVTDTHLDDMIEEDFDNAAEIVLHIRLRGRPTQGTGGE